jgi:DMSO reductase anchor subunit
VFHLGRPLYAFRAVIGLRTSWMSREIVAFGGFAFLAVGYAIVSITGAGSAALRDLLGTAVAATGLIGIACSVLIYHATKKAWWTVSITGFKFFMTAALLGIASTILLVSSRELAAQLSHVVVAASAIKLAGELTVLVHLRDKRYTELKRSAVLLVNDLRRWSIGRIAALVLGGIVLPIAGPPSLTRAVISLGLLVTGELLERTLFFAAASSPGMPKGVR